MAVRDCIELEFVKDPSRLLEELGLKTKQFETTKSNILTRLAGRPEIQIIVLEFQRSGLYYGEVTYGKSEHYRQTRTQRGEALGRAARRDSNRLEEPTVGGDDGVLDGSSGDGWSLEQLLSTQLAKS